MSACPLEHPAQVRFFKYRLCGGNMEGGAWNIFTRFIIGAEMREIVLDKESVVFTCAAYASQLSSFILAVGDSAQADNIVIVVAPPD